VNPNTVVCHRLSSVADAGHTNDFHNGDPYLRDYLDPRQEPWLREYDDSDPATIAAQLKVSRQANIRLWVSSWFGPNSRTDTTMRNTMLPHPDLGSSVKFAIHYETNNRLRDKVTNTYKIDNVAPDMVHLCTYYFKHPDYFRHNGRPVLVLYLSRAIDNAGIGATPNPSGFWRRSSSRCERRP
jgi:hypothetical protein